MRNELIDRSNPEVPEENRIELVLQKSKETSLLRFERQIYNAETGKGAGGWYSLLVKTPALFNNEQFAIFRAVHGWRDKIARMDDDSTGFLMPNHVIFTIAKLMPMDMMALLGIAHPISHSVKSRAGELLELIKSAKTRGKDGPSMMDILRPDTVGAIAKANLPSVAAKSAPALVAVVDESELRSEQSSFWGGAFGSSLWDTPSAIKTDDGLRLAVPLPQLSSEVFAQASNGLTDRSRVQSISTTELTQPATPTPKNSDQSFVLKRGAKRKSDNISLDTSDAEEENNEYDISFAPLNEDERQEQEEKKKAKKAKKLMRAEKRAQRAAKNAAAQAQGQADDDEEPFDYSKAESVLHGKKNSGADQGGAKKKKPFDPYAKSADAPKGMRRVQTERPGKSHTFKS